MYLTNRLKEHGVEVPERHVRPTAGAHSMETVAILIICLALLALARWSRGAERPEFIGRPNDPCDTPEHLKKVLDTLPPSR